MDRVQALEDEVEARDFALAKLTGGSSLAKILSDIKYKMNESMQSKFN